MAAWRYEISLLVLKKYFTHSLRSCSWNIFQHSNRNFVSPRGHVISSMYHPLLQALKKCQNCIYKQWYFVSGVVPSLRSSLCLHVLVYSHHGLWSVWRWLRCYRLRYSIRWDRTRLESIIHRCHGLVHKTSHCTLAGILIPSCVHLLQMLLYVIIMKVML